MLPHIDKYTFTKLRLIIAFAFIFLIAPWATAIGQKYSLGIKAGACATLATFRDTDLKDQFGTKIKPGFKAAGVVMFPLKEKYYFVSEGGYAQLGKRLLFNSDQWDNDVTFRFVDLSMALRRSFPFKLKEDLVTNWYLNIGPNVQYWLSGTGRLRTGGDPFIYSIAFDQQPTADFNINYYNDVNRWLFGLDIGVGADALIKTNHKVYAELRFTWGHTNLGKPSSQSSMEILGWQDDLRSNLKTLTLSGAYIIDFDRKASRMGKSTKNKKTKITSKPIRKPKRGKRNK